MDEMCDCSDRQKHQAMAIKIRVQDNALFFSHEHMVKLYEKVIDLLRKR